MGDTKHIRLTVRSASQKEIQDAIHRDFVPGVHSHKYPEGADRNSVTVEVVGDVDAGKLYHRLKKIRSSVEVEIEFEIEIESVIPNQQCVAKMKRLEEDLKSEIKSLNEDMKNLHRKIEDLEYYKVQGRDIGHVGCGAGLEQFDHYRRATKRELERLKQQLGQLKI